MRISSFLRKETEAWSEGSESHSNPPNMIIATGPTFSLLSASCQGWGRRAAAILGTPRESSLLLQDHEEGVS